ncbi:MAG: hypothetical protein K2P59_05700 [Acetatifactor sp.]|nr:hypothetical protein [Acetatifactor sp.]
MREQRAAEQEMQKQRAAERTMGERKIRKAETREPEAYKQEKIWETASELKPDPFRKQDSLILIRSGIHEKKIRNTPFPGELLWIQVQYITPVFWVLQGGVLSLLLLLLYRMPGQRAELTDYLWWSSIAAAWMGVLSNGVLGRHFSSRMAELEQSCYINLSQMWTIRMILTTGVDIFTLTMFSGGIAARTDTFFGRIAMYLLVPFMLSNICCLLMISALRNGRGKYTLAALAVITALLAMAPSVFAEVYTTAYLWVWFCLLVLGAVIFAGQIRSCYGRMTKGEMICWN